MDGLNEQEADDLRDSFEKMLGAYANGFIAIVRQDQQKLDDARAAFVKATAAFSKSLDKSMNNALSEINLANFVPDKNSKAYKALDAAYQSRRRGTVSGLSGEEFRRRLTGQGGDV